MLRALLTLPLLLLLALVVSLLLFPGKVGEILNASPETTQQIAPVQVPQPQMPAKPTSVPVKAAKNARPAVSSSRK